MSAQQERARRSLAARKLIEETQDADLLEFVLAADMSEMAVCAFNEVTAEWAQQIRQALPEDFDYGCGCPTCTVTRGLNYLCRERT